MSFICSRLLLRYSSSSIKTHYRKLSKELPGVFTRYSLAPHRRHFSIEKEPPRDLKDEFELFDDAEPSYYDVNVEEITESDPELMKSLKLCQLEVNLLAQNGDAVPKTLNSEQWRELIKLPGRAQRAHFLRFLWLNEHKRNNDRLKKQQKRQQYLESKAARGEKDRTAELSTNAPVEYGINQTALFHRIRNSEIDRLNNWKVLQALQFGPQILIDCSYEPFMNARENNLCVRQLLLMWAENRCTNRPFDVIFCNLKETSPALKKVRKMMPTIDNDPCFPFSYTEKNYLDLYPKEKLVYLSPHCNVTLDKYNGDDIYIIGAMVDKSHSEPISLAKAKKDGIRLAKFPLDLYLNWKMGVKSLTLNQSLAIMNDIKDGRDWWYALRHVPRRKVCGSLIDEETKEVRETKHSAKTIRGRYRRNLIYDLLSPTKANYLGEDFECEDYQV